MQDLTFLLKKVCFKFKKFLDETKHGNLELFYVIKHFYFFKEIAGSEKLIK